MFRLKVVGRNNITTYSEEMNNSNLNKLKSFLIDNLEYDIYYHLNDKYELIGVNYSKFEDKLLGDEDEFDIIYTVLYFWDCWMDARNHEWKYHDPIKKDDWPILAKEIIKSLLNNTEIKNKLLIDRNY